MSLSAREEQVLRSMEDGLARCDPKLASLLATFTRLASGEEMPARERIPGLRRRDARRLRRLSHRDRVSQLVRRLPPHPGSRPAGSRPAAALWLAAVAAVALVAIALALGHGRATGACTTSWSTVCTGPVSAHPPGTTAHHTTPGQVPSTAHLSGASRRQG